MLLLVLLPLFQPDFKLTGFFDTIELLDGVAYLILVIVLGALYYISKLRWYFWRPRMQQVHDNIKTQLLMPFETDPKISKSSEKLTKGRVLLTVFYKFIDTDPSLSEKAKGVYFNGLIWSSVADAMAISIVFCGVYVVAYFVTSQINYLYFAAILLLLYLIFAFVLMPLATKQHVELGNEQLEHIHLYYEDQLRSELHTIIERETKQ